MSFAVAPHAPDLAVQIMTEWSARCARRPDLILFALADCMIDPAFPQFCAAQGWAPPLSVYLGQPRFAPAEQEAPSLLALPAGPGELARILDPLLARCIGKPMLGFLATRLTVQALQAQLMRQAIVTDTDNQQWVLRFGDTRVWPPDEDWLTPMQREQVLAGIDVWMVVDRYGQLRVCEGCPDAEARPVDHPGEVFRLSDTQLANMMAASEADAQLAQLAEVERFARLPRSSIEQYETTLRCLATLDRLGIESAAERHACVRIAVQWDGDFDQHPVVRHWMPATGRRLSEALKATGLSSEDQA